MASPREIDDDGQRPNMWEELNRPRDDHRRQPPAPAPTPDAPIAEPVGTETSTDTAPRQIESQHLLLIGAVLFVGVAFFALRGLGSSGPATLALDEPSPTTIVGTPMTAPLSTATPTTSAAPEAMAMGLPASLLDSEQSQVFRLYRTALGREPDRSGFEFWSNQVRDGVPLEQLADGFLSSEEYQAQFTEGNEWENRVEQLLTNAFGPAADEAELESRRGQFVGLDGAALLLAISEADETLAATGTLR